MGLKKSTTVEKQVVGRSVGEGRKSGAPCEDVRPLASMRIVPRGVVKRRSQVEIQDHRNGGQDGKQNSRSRDRGFPIGEVRGRLVLGPNEGRFPRRAELDPPAGNRYGRPGQTDDARKENR